MNISGLLLNQIIIMFVLMSLGFLFYKINYITDQGSKDIAKILLYMVIPVVIVKNFMIENSAENIEVLLHSTIISAVCMFVAIVISHLLFDKDGVANFSSSFSNAGFIGIPLVEATLGSKAVFYISMMIIMINILQWTYGVFVMTNDISVIKPKKIVTNPIAISVVIGLCVFAFQIPMPSMVTTVFSLISGLNTPLAMIVSGVYLAQSDLVAMLKKKSIYMVSLARLVIVPLVTLLVFKVIPFGTVDVKMAILIAAACPVGTNVAIFAQTYSKDYHSAVEQVCMTTIMCLVTLPLLIGVAEAIL